MTAIDKSASKYSERWHFFVVVVVVVVVVFITKNAFPQFSGSCFQSYCDLCRGGSSSGSTSDWESKGLKFDPRLDLGLFPSSILTNFSL